MWSVPCLYYLIYKTPGRCIAQRTETCWLFGHPPPSTSHGTAPVLNNFRSATPCRTLAGTMDSRWNTHALSSCDLNTRRHIYSVSLPLWISSPAYHLDRLIARSRIIQHRPQDLPDNRHQYVSNVCCLLRASEVIRSCATHAMHAGTIPTAAAAVSSFRLRASTRRLDVLSQWADDTSSTAGGQESELSETAKEGKEGMCDTQQATQPYSWSTLLLPG